MKKPQLNFGVSFIIYRLILVICFAAILGQSQNDADVMGILKKTINAPNSLGWTDKDICKWEHVECNPDKRVTSIQIGNENLIGSLPKELENLSELQHFECHRNSLTGPFPYLSKQLQRLTIYDNKFTSMPNDFFKGMIMLQDLRIGNNPFSQWPIPDSLRDCGSLQSFSAVNSSFIGQIPDFFGKRGGLPVLVSLIMNENHLEGPLPASFAGSSIEQLVLHGNSKLNGSIEVLQNMTSLKQVWLHGNSFTGGIPDLSKHDQLSDVSLRDNQLACAVPKSLMDLPSLKVVNLTNNLLEGPIPTFKSGVVADVPSGLNRFCSNTPGQPCSPIVNALLSVVESLECPGRLADSWKGNDPCTGSWLGIVCTGGNISIINFQNMGLSGSISPSFATLTSVTKLILANNYLSGPIPTELTTMPHLQELDVSNNRLGGYVPPFRKDVVVKVGGNPDIGKPLGSHGASDSEGVDARNHTIQTVGIVIGVVLFVILALLLARKLKLMDKFRGPESKVIIFPNDSEDGTKSLKIVTVSGSGDGMVIPIHVLREVTNNFDEAKVLGKGGFGTVYKGVLQDGTEIAVKRMVSGMVVEKGLKEFQAEISVLTKVRHKHLVALLGHCVEGNERLLVYEYMSQGALSRYLFDWKEEDLKPLSWTLRLKIALDVARGVEYLHSLAQQTFIHRDLKPSNILLGNDMRAKVADFGLVRPTPQGKASIETRLAGTFGYLAPEYAATGRVTTKVDVYSYGVILMEVVTGRRVLDDTNPDENFHLVSWFKKMVLNKDTFAKSIDPTLILDTNNNTNETVVSSIKRVSELAGHCCAREPNQRPDMSYVVNVLSSLVQAWKPTTITKSHSGFNDGGGGGDDDDDDGGVDLEMSLPQALKKWQSMDDDDVSPSQSFLNSTTHGGNKYE